MDEKTRLLISLGAATAANCIPCFEFYYGKACEMKLTEGEIGEAVDLASKVKKGAHISLKNSVSSIMNGQGESGESCCTASQASCCD